MYCNKCGSQNPDTATSCQKCGQPLSATPQAQPAQPAQPAQAPKKKRGCLVAVLIAVGVVVIVVIIIVASCAASVSGVLSATSTPPALAGQVSGGASASAAPGVQTFTTGDIIQASKIKVTIESFKKLEGTEYQKPDDGKEWVQIVLLVENTSDEEVVISSATMFTAYVDDMAMGENYSAQLMDESIKSMDGTLAAGKKLRGQLAYEVPKDWKKIQVDLDAAAFDLFENEKITMLFENK